jgi:5'-phosphate synthase pdxT subunit
MGRLLARRGLPVLATCAGMILLARNVTDPAQASLGVLDVDVARNAYGRQIHSGTYPIEGPGVPEGTLGLFIRAPRVMRVGPGVEVLAWRGNDPVLVRQGDVLAACFHPELVADHPVTQRFAAMVRQAGARWPGAGAAPA